MKRFTVLFFVICLIFTLAGCNTSTPNHQINATLYFGGVQEGDKTDLTQVLTEEETQKAKEYLSSAELMGYEPKCLFNENISITLDGKVYAIAYDSCPSFWLVDTNDYYTMSEEGKSYIVSLFTKYVGYFPFP